jgi:hypothetical protein
MGKIFAKGKIDLKPLDQALMISAAAEMFNKMQITY